MGFTGLIATVGIAFFLSLGGLNLQGLHTIKFTNLPKVENLSASAIFTLEGVLSILENLMVSEITYKREG